jgi:hypothetical protein
MLFLNICAFDVFVVTYYNLLKLSHIGLLNKHSTLNVGSDYRVGSLSCHIIIQRGGRSLEKYTESLNILICTLLFRNTGESVYLYRSHQWNATLFS